jgi:hypothetical protein
VTGSEAKAETETEAEAATLAAPVVMETHAARD